MLPSLCGFRHPLGTSSCGSLWLGECLPGNVDLGVNLIVDVLLRQFFWVVYLQLKRPAGNRTAWSDKDTRNTDLHILNILSKNYLKKTEKKRNRTTAKVGGGGGRRKGEGGGSFTIMASLGKSDSSLQPGLAACN